MVGELGHLLDALAVRLTPTMAVRLRLMFAVVVLISLTAGSRWTGGQLSAAPALTDLQGVGELKALFNRDVGKVRLVLLLSPT
jgi:hypothetical protein